jgi:signal transduction histidine kinase
MVKRRVVESNLYEDNNMGDKNSLNKDLNFKIQEINHVIQSIASGDFTARAEVTQKADIIDALAVGVNMLAEELDISTIGLEYVDDRIEELLEIIQITARGDFSKNCKISGKNDSFDALAVGINMMIDDLRERTNEIEKNHKLLNQKIDELEKTEHATLNIMEDLQESIQNLRKAEKEIRIKNKKLASTQEELKVFNEELEQKIKERTSQIEKLLKQKDEFINQLGHDLKTPLTPLITLLPIIKKRQTDKKSRELLDVSIINIQYMQNLVIKTIQLARLNAPSFKLDIEDINILEELNKILDSNQFILKEKKMSVINKIDSNFIVKADKLRLDELFNNLITNAVKYSSKEGILTIDAKKDRDFVTISFKDNGMGLTKEQINYIFEEFYKVDPSRHYLDSSGLGLPICKRIVEKHGGKIWVESPGPGKGSTFYFTLKKLKNKKNI